MIHWSTKYDPMCKCGHRATSHGQVCMAGACKCLGFESVLVEHPPAQPMAPAAGNDWLKFAWKAAEEVLKVMAHGDNKPGRTHGDWRGRDKNYFLRKALRHLVAYIGGEEKDPESGLSHLAHAAANLLYALEV